AKFVRATQLCLKDEITQADLQEIRRLFAEFVEHYEKEYYQYKEERLPACLSSIHYLLHVADMIQGMGPVRYYWQFPMERECGMLGPLVKSAVLPYANLASTIRLRESLHHVCFALKRQDLISPTDVQLEPLPPHRAISDGSLQEIYSPSKDI